MDGSGAVEAGSKMRRADREKSPARNSGVATVDTKVCAVRNRNASQPTKKNVRPLPWYTLGTPTGPPATNPNWFRFRSSGRLARLKKLRASNLSFRRKFHNVP